MIRTGVLTASVALTLSLLATPARAAFIDDPEEGIPGYLSLRTDPSPLIFTDLSHGDVEYGQIQVVFEDAESADLRLDAELSGPLADRPGGLRMDAAVCDVVWTAIPADVTSDASPVCETGGRPLLTLAADLPQPGEMVWDLGTLDRGERLYVLVTLRMPEGETPGLPELDGLSAGFAYRVDAFGDDPVIDDPTETAPDSPWALAATGAGVGGLALIAAVFLVVGLASVGASVSASVGRRRRS